jgi:hypothetical protein
MRSNTFKVTTLFLVGGFCSGLITAALIHYSTAVVWTGAGLVFVFGVGASFLLSRTRRWLLLKPSLRQYSIFALTATLGYPLSILIMGAVSDSYVTLYRLLLPNAWQEQLSARQGMAIDDEGIYLGLYCAAVAAAVLVSFALWIVDRRWDGKGFALLIIAGIATVLVFHNLPAETAYYIENVLVLLIVGDTLFTGLCGYRLARAEARMNRSDDSTRGTRVQE